MKLYALIVAGLMALSPHLAHAETAYERVMKSGVLRCGYWVMPPISAKDPNTGAVSGFAPALIEAMADKLNIKVAWTEEVTFGTMMAGLEAGRYDAICSGVYLAAIRARVMEYSTPYLYTITFPAVRSDDHRFDADAALMDQPGVKVAVQSEMGEQLGRRLFPRAELIVLPETASVGEILLGLVGGKYDIVPLDAFHLYDFNRENSGKVRFIHTEHPLRVFPWVIPVRKGEHDLMTFLDAALLELYYNGEIRAIAKATGLPDAAYYFSKPILQPGAP